MYKKLIATLSITTFLMLGLAWAEAADTAKVAKIKTELKGMLGGEEPDNVRATEMPGLYEVTLGTEVVYVSEDARFLMYGNLIDRVKKVDLTRKAQEDAEKAFAGKRKAMMDKQDASKTITYKAKNEKQVLTVFTDIDCPYCAKIHNEIPELNKQGITVSYYLFPRAGVGSPSFKKAVSAWCADDNLTALTKAKNREAIPAKTCENPVAAQYELGREVGVTGTPALITEKGTLLPGYVPANILVSKLEEEKAAK
ncbi:MAG: Thiol:disulfide interchange protein DsbC [uncultured Thiotrichaceae bacterium]|uniref:Thiol:disulfide interchange protein n=1 Tax=uncultured Thiotrichaceae bacterium TaxID=298394 RepID=A0A6S6T6U3_9GAMM|nr:MAG: Thiol:disulfide interchange protein DsbC [uncultured Thiotrichaceae bacterium]